MRRVHPLPTMLTLGNFGCGFVAIVLAARSLSPEIDAEILPLSGQQATYFYMSCACIFLAMLFDMLDGKVARMTGSACQFGGEMDSLADVVSFCITPAVIICISWLNVEPESAKWWSSILGSGFIYAACGSIRLARYNVEMDTSAKDYFRGLPSPAAGGAVVSTFMFIHYTPFINASANAPYIYKVFAIYMLVMGLLMVTRVRYPHASNKLLGGQKKIVHLVIALFALALFFRYPIYFLTVGFNAYALMGLGGEAYRFIRRKNFQQEKVKQNEENKTQKSTSNVKEEESSLHDNENPEVKNRIINEIQHN